MCGLGVPVGCRRGGHKKPLMCGFGKRRRGLERQNLQTKPAGGKRTWPKHVIFMSLKDKTCRQNLPEENVLGRSM